MVIQKSLLLLGLHMTCLVAKDLLTTLVFHLENGFRVIATYSIQIFVNLANTEKLSWKIHFWMQECRLEFDPTCGSVLLSWRSERQASALLIYHSSLVRILCLVNWLWIVFITVVKCFQHRFLRLIDINRWANSHHLIHHWDEAITEQNPGLVQ